MKPILQHRWKLTGKILQYYGLRCAPKTMRRQVCVSRRTAEIIKHMDGRQELSCYARTYQINKLIKQGIIVDVCVLTKPVQSFDEAKFCKNCCANDYMIPGLQLNADGVCPLCENDKKFKNLKSVLPIVKSIPHSDKSKFDVAVFYTGGKDSSFLLYYLSRVLHLRVLSLTWQTPYMSDNAMQSIENAKKAMPEVTFLVKKAPEKELQKIYKKAYELQQNTCICPSVAYVLFYEYLVEQKVSYVILGNEPAQCKNLIYNQIAPAFYYQPWIQDILHVFLNIGRVICLKEPFQKGQVEMYMTVKNLAFGMSPLIKYTKYRNPIVENTITALKEAPNFMMPFQEAVKKSARSAAMPALIHMDFNEISKENVYNWQEVKQTLAKEIGWVDSPEENKGLHTSCKIERCKEFSQFQLFQAMKSPVIPFSAMELPLAVIGGNISREKAIEELKLHSGFAEVPPPESEIMIKGFTDTCGDSSACACGKQYTSGESGK